LSPETTKLESSTREEIDRKLEAAGWVIQDKKCLNLFQSLGVAMREMDTDTGPADYMLFIDGKACGIIAAKREGTDAADPERRGVSLESMQGLAGPHCLSRRAEL